MTFQLGTYGLAPQDGLENVQTIPIGQKQHPTADGMIKRAHRDSTDRGFYLTGTTMDLILAPSLDYEMAIVKVTAHFGHPDFPGETFSFTDIGDATPANCSSANTAAAFVRMAATRALSRAIAVGLNIAEAVAEEMVANGGTAPAGSGAGPAQAGATGSSGAAATAGKPAVAAQFPGAPAWKFTIPGGNNKGQNIDSAAVSIEDLKFWMGKGFFTKNPQTQQYDVPDPVRHQIFEAEIARRMGGSANVAQPAAAAATPNYNQTAPAASGGSPPAGEWNAQPYITTLLKAAKAQGKNWPQVKAWSQETFGVPEPAQLDRDSFSMLLFEFGGGALP